MSDDTTQFFSQRLANKLVTIALVAWAGFITMEVITAKIELKSIDLQVKEIRSNRFTDKNGADMERRLLEHFQANYPPAWLKDDVTEIKASLRLLDERLRIIETSPLIRSNSASSIH